VHRELDLASIVEEGRKKGKLGGNLIVEICRRCGITGVGW
jgi:hypothetical protein